MGWQQYLLTEIKVGSGLYTEEDASSAILNKALTGSSLLSFFPKDYLKKTFGGGCLRS